MRPRARHDLVQRRVTDAAGQPLAPKIGGGWSGCAARLTAICSRLNRNFARSLAASAAFTAAPAADRPRQWRPEHRSSRAAPAAKQDMPGLRPNPSARRAVAPGTHSSSDRRRALCLICRFRSSSRLSLRERSPWVYRESIVALPDSPIIEIRASTFSTCRMLLTRGRASRTCPRRRSSARPPARPCSPADFYLPNCGTPTVPGPVEYYQRLYGLDISEKRIAHNAIGHERRHAGGASHGAARRQRGDRHPGLAEHHARHENQRAAIREAPLSRSDAGWTLDLDRVFDQCDEHTRVIYTASPGNPTGWMMRREQAEALLDFARRRNIALLSDEMYHRIVYDGERGVLAAADCPTGRSGIRGEQLFQILGHDRMAHGLDNLPRRSDAGI